MFGFFKRLFRRKYIKHTFWTPSISSGYLQELFDVCSLIDYEVCDYAVKYTGYGWDVIVYTKKKDRMQ